MNDILFRGICKETRKWVYGQSFKDIKGFPYILIGSWQIDFTKHELFGGMCIKVFPETVGQYIGLKDRNGNKIFEGDKVKFSWDSECSCREFCDGKNGCPIYTEETMIAPDYPISPPSACEYDYISFYHLDGCGNEPDYFEIIGTIHDNLLKGN